MKLANYLNNPSKSHIREGFGQGLKQAAQLDQNIVGLCADLADSTRMSVFRDSFPDRYIEVGVAEQNLIGVSAGLALAGKIPFAASYAVFSPGRSWEQIRVSVCYSNLNVKIVGSHASLNVGADGATHQGLEDIALMRVLPNMTVLVPCDAQQARQATLAMAQHLGPSYIRFGRDKLADVTTNDTPFEIGKALVFRPGSDVTVIACGPMVYQSLLAAEELAKEKIDVQVINIHTIKPIDTAAIIDAAKLTGAIVTAEDHQIIGGLASAVAETLVENYPVPMERVGVKDIFGESGSADDLVQKYGLTSQEVIKAVKKVVKRKQNIV
jgi:transketolase